MDKNETGERIRGTMTNLVNSVVLLARQVSLAVDGPFLEEEANFVTRGKEVVVTDVVIVPGGELGLLRDVA